MSELEILDLPDTAYATALDTELMDSTAEVCASANNFLRAEMRKAYPYMKTAALDGMMREVLSVMEKRIEESEPDQAAAKARTSFFSLPAELRNRIYEVHFEISTTHKTYVFLNEFLENTRSGKTKVPGDIRLPAILQASRTLREETLAMYYSNRVFIWSLDRRSWPLERKGPLLSWLDRIGCAQASMIKKLVIESYIRCIDLEAMIWIHRGNGETSGYPRDTFVGDFLRAMGLGNCGIQSIVLSYEDAEGNWVERTEGLLVEPFANSGLPDEVFDGEEGWDGVLFENDAAQMAPVDGVAESVL